MAEGTKGVVVGCDSGLYKVKTDKGEISCKPRGRFRYEKLRLLAGDSVSLYEDDKGVCIDAVCERKNALIRPPIANVDVLFVVSSVTKPDPILLNIDKLTSIAEQNEIRPVLILTKTELSREKTDELRAIYEKTGYQVYETSAVCKIGISELRSAMKELCREKIAVFAGASGVGKSTLLNVLFPSLSQLTNEISAKIGRGRHTTRTVELFDLSELLEGGSGFIADTPGFSLLDFESFDFYSLDDLPYNFPEFKPYLGCCRYTKCTHRREEGCAILNAVREGLVAPSRQESYRILYDQLKEKHPWD